jgi:hypothetical protein
MIIRKSKKEVSEVLVFPESIAFPNLNDWPCIFDENLEPKPAYYDFMKGLTLD